MIRLFISLLLLPLSDPAAAIDEASPFISLEEIEPGDQGEWRTAVTGNEIKTFPLEVVGILESFSGPGMPIILCRATDDENTRTGPVSGMSGSPVFINGRLAGAYAYGFPWSKEKTLIGVTPIDWMLPLLEKENQPYLESQQGAPPGGADPGGKAALGMPLPLEAISASRSNAASPEPLPIPLLASGVSAETLRAVAPWLEEQGLRLASGITGSGGETSLPDLEPGSPIAVILAEGDLKIGGVGTVTWVDGDRVLGFGHPMLGSGSTELPVGKAEIVDIVSNYRISFKLSNLGKAEGTLWQDSTSGIQAQMGRTPYMIPIRIESDAGIKTPVTGNLVEHRNFTSSMALLYAARTLLSSEEGPADATILGDFEILIEGEEDPLTFHRRGVGFSGAVDSLFFFANKVDRLLNGTQELPRIEHIEVNLKTSNTERIQHLHAIQLDSARIRAGEPVRLSIQTRLRNGSLAQHDLQIPIPADAIGEPLSILVADADTIAVQDRLGLTDNTAPLADLIAILRQFRSNGEIHVRLISPSRGLRLEGKNLENLPPSVLSLYSSSLQSPGELFLQESVVWEESIPVPGVFSGTARLNFETEP